MDKESYKQYVKSIAGSKDVIPGIHNYCDRWCERCTHTSKCSVFKIEQKMSLSNEELDVKNDQFWKSLSTIFEAIKEMLQEKMTELDIDMETVKKDKNSNYITEPLDTEMVQVSRNYTMEVAKWLDQHRDKILENFELQQNINENNALIIADAVEVIQHYFMMVATKTYRASLVFNDPDDDTDDSRGSAKVTIILIDRSIAAWSTLLNYFPSFEDDILQFLKILSKVKRLLLSSFPTAMEFRRPGFDE